MTLVNKRTYRQLSYMQRLDKRMNRPMLDAMGRPIGQPLNGSQPDPVQGILFPVYFNVVAALAQGHHGTAPAAIADEAMEIAIAALAKIGISISTKTPENPE